MAVIALLGRTANGWMEWKGKDGATLDELETQSRAGRAVSLHREIGSWRHRVAEPACGSERLDRP